MSQTIELKVQKLLLEKENFAAVADDLLQEWDSNATTDGDREAIAFFLLNAGLIRQLLEKVSQQISQQGKVFWPIYRTILTQVEQHLESKIAAALIEGVKEDSFEPALFYSSSLQPFSEEFSDSVTIYKKKLQSEFEDRIRDFLDRVQFLKSQRLFEEERRALENLGQLNPSFTEIKKLWADYNERWALHIVSTKQNIEYTDRLTKKVQAQWRAEMQPAFQPIWTQIQELVVSTPELALDLVMMTHFMDFSEEALHLARLSPPSMTRDWMIAELLLDTRRFVDLLEWVNGLEIKYVHDNDVAFAASYLKARAFRGLGQDLTAIDLINSILKIRPNYRSAPSLLQEWQKGAQ